MSAALKLMANPLADMLHQFLDAAETFAGRDAYSREVIGFINKTSEAFSAISMHDFGRIDASLAENVDFIRNFVSSTARKAVTSADEIESRTLTALMAEGIKGKKSFYMKWADSAEEVIMRAGTMADMHPQEIEARVVAVKERISLYRQSYQLAK